MESFKVSPQGTINSEHHIYTDQGAQDDTCLVTFSSEPFSFGISIFGNSSQTLVFASYSTEAANQTYEEALSIICADKPNGITAFRLSVLEAGEDHSQCDHHQVCVRLSRRLRAARNLKLTFTKTELLKNSDVTATLQTSVLVQLERIGRKRG